MRPAATFGLFVAVLLAGCSQEGPTRFRVSGDATFGGTPIPFGDIVFTPDGSKQNSGAQGIAHIRDGKFDTSNLDGKGIGGGPMILRVTGLSGPGGKVICEYEYKADLPKADSKLNVEVPATAVPGKLGSGPEI